MSAVLIDNENPTMELKPSISRRPLQRLSVNSSPKPSSKKNAVNPAKSKQLNKSPFCPNVLVLSENRSVTSNVKSKIGPLDTSEGSESSIFIRKTVDGGWDESWTLKRANPVYDSDDEDFIVMNCSPPKKQRTTDLTLDSGNRLSNGNNGFPIKLQTHIC